MSLSGRGDWHSYNEALVRRGELDLDSSVLEEWKRELKKANDGKVGEPYHYPESYIRLLAFVRLLFHQPYRQTEGFVRFLSKFVEGLQVPDYSTIDRRTNRLQISLDESLIESNNPVTIAVDSSGVKVHNMGDWIRHVWKVKKGYLKIHFAVDIRTGQVVSMDVSSEKVGDGKRLKRLVERAEENVRVGRVLTDGAYDSKANFNFLAGEGIKPVIRVRKGSVQKSDGSYARKLAVVEQQAGVQAEGVEQHPPVRVQVEGRGSVLRHQEGLRGIRHGNVVNMAVAMAMEASIYNRFIKATV